MKTYYLKLQKSDFEYDESGLVFRSDIVDLYNNDSYSNYSTTKSVYGTNLLSNNVWTGMNEISPTVTEAGEISDSKFIDYSGRIDITSIEIEIVSNSGLGSILTAYNVFGSSDEDAAFPEEYSSTKNIISDNIFLINHNRYAVFEIQFSTEESLETIDFNVFVKVDISPPIMAPFYDSTRRMSYKFPEWTDFNKDSGLAPDTDSATPAYLYTDKLATPNYLGTSILNAVSGQWLDELEFLIKKYGIEQYIDTADIDQRYQAYSTDISLIDHVVTIYGDGAEVPRTSSMFEFDQLLPDEDGVYIDFVDNKIYSNLEYSSFEINGQSKDQTILPIWNWFDEFGMIVDLYRIKNEDNTRFKARILDVYKNKSGVSMTRFKNAIRRELDLWNEYGATPSSNANFATPIVYEIGDIENLVEGASPYMGYDDIPTQRFVDLAETLNQNYPLLWGHFVYGHAYWDITGANNDAIGYLAHKYDSTPVLDSKLYQPGVGDGDDLYVYKPGVISGPVNFSADIEVRGKQKVFREEHPELTFNFELVAQADRKIYDNEDVSTNCYLQFTVLSDDATPVEETYIYNFVALSKSDIFFDQATPSFNSIVSPADISQHGIFSLETVLYAEDGSEVVVNIANQDRFNLLANIAPGTDIVFGVGYFNPDTALIVDETPAEDIRLGWEDESPSAVTSGTYNITRPADDGWVMPIVLNYESASPVGVWESEPISYSIILNGAPPDEGQQSYVFTFPDVVWPSDLEATPNKKWKITATSAGGSIFSPSARFLSYDGNYKYLPLNKIAVDGNSTWTSNSKTFTYGTEEITFSSLTSTSPVYPEPDTSAYIWDYFSATISNAITGVVDEDGVWRHGVPPYPNSKSTILDSVSLNRDDFSLSNEDDVVITWIDVHSNNNNVETWFETNTVKSESASNLDIDYGSSYIDELYDSDDDTYYFERLVVHAKLKNTPDPHWYPQVHSGFVHIENQERYLYIEPNKETISNGDKTKILSSVVRQGAPIVVKTNEATPVYFRQTAFSDATPSLTLVNTETIFGSGKNGLYLSHNDVYDVAAINLTDNADLTLPNDNTPSNFIETNQITDRNKQYQVSYVLKNSFYVDSDFYDDNKLRSMIVLDKSPDDLGIDDIEITYESSSYYPATPIDVPLNPFYTTVDEGFIFLTTGDYDLSKVEVKFSPAKLTATEDDFCLLSIKAYDNYGNPKEDEVFNITTDYGDIDNDTVITDKDGYASAILTAENTAPSGYVANIELSGNFDAEFTLPVIPIQSDGYKLVAVPSANAVQADGKSNVSIVGKITKTDSLPAANSVIRYRKGRTIYSVFTKEQDTTVIPEMATPVWGESGLVVADSNGIFSLGPFSSATPDEPGYWFVAVESKGATPLSGGATPGTDTYEPHDMVGDVVYWYEYPEILYGTENVSGQIKPNANVIDLSNATPISATPLYPVDYNPDNTATPSEASVNWAPPKWYAINKYKQYQYGILGNNPEEIDFDNIDEFHPDYKGY